MRHLLLFSILAAMALSALPSAGLALDPSKKVCSVAMNKTSAACFRATTPPFCLRADASQKDRSAVCQIQS